VTVGDRIYALNMDMKYQQDPIGGVSSTQKVEHHTSVMQTNDSTAVVLKSWHVLIISSEVKKT